MMLTKIWKQNKNSNIIKIETQDQNQKKKWQRLLEIKYSIWNENLLDRTNRLETTKEK